MRALTTQLLIAVAYWLVIPLKGQVVLSYTQKFDAYVSNQWNCGTYGDPLHHIKGGKPEFWDMDGDGISELFIGLSDYSGQIEQYRNIGTPEDPCYVLEDPFFEDIILPFGLEFAAPDFADVNGDGLADLFLGNGIAGGQGGFVQLYLNGGQVGDPEFVLVLDTIAGLDVHDASVPFAVDLDDDGDTDLLVGGGLGDVYYVENIGTPTQFDFSAPPALIAELTYRVAPVAADLDADGDYELYLLEAYGRIYQYEDVDPSPDGFLWEEVSDHWLGYDACPASGGCILRMAFHDQDNDSDLDLWISAPSPYIRNQLFRNIGDTLNFIPQKTFSEYPHLNSGQMASFGDLNNSGFTDWIVRRGFYFSLTQQSLLNGTEHWELITEDLFGLQQHRSNVAFYDFDGDGDLDAKLGMGGLSDGNIKSFENIGTPTAAQFVPYADVVLDTLGFEGRAICAIQDLDNDGLADLLVLSGNSVVAHLEDQDPDTGLLWGMVNDSLITGLHASAGSISLPDLDGDGDFDLYISTFLGPKLFWNSGGPEEPIFVPANVVTEGVPSNNQYVMADLTADCGLELIVDNQLFVLEGIQPQIITSTDTICLNEGLVQLLAQPAEPPGTWGGAADLNGIIDPAALGAGMHSVYYAYTDAFGCANRADTAVFLIPEALEASFTAQVLGDSVWLNASATTDDILWALGDGTISEETTLLYVYNDPGSYQICLTAFSDCDTLVTCQEIEILASGLASHPGVLTHTLSPNPSSGDLLLSLSRPYSGSYVMEVFSGQGALVLRKEGLSHQREIQLTGLRHLPAGVYFYNLMLEDVLISGKFDLF